MVAAANQQDGADQVSSLLELTKDMIVQEVGWDSDCDASISEAVEDAVGSELLEEDTDEVVDAVLLWWREGDGDLVDRLMDVVTPLADEGHVWVLTPKTGTDGHVEPAVIAESAQTAGMLQTRCPCARGSVSGSVVGPPPAAWGPGPRIGLSVGALP